MWGKITPTDMDCLLEFYDKAYVGVEATERGRLVKYGQRLAFERAFADWHKIGKATLLLVAIQPQGEPEPINYANLTVGECYYNGTWCERFDGMPVRQSIDEFLSENDIQP
jgi:hypothetical protein